MSAKPVVAAVMTPIVALVKGIRAIAAWNTSVCMAYITDAAPFASLTQKQQESVFKAACSLMSLKLGVPVGAEGWASALLTLQAALAQAQKDGRSPRFGWVHQRYSPLPMPGENRYASLSQQYTSAVAEGRIKPAQDFVEAVSANLWHASTNPTGKLEQQPRLGGFILAVHEDAETQRAERKANKPARATVTRATML